MSIELKDFDLCMPIEFRVLIGTCLLKSVPLVFELALCGEFLTHRGTASCRFNCMRPRAAKYYKLQHSWIGRLILY